MKTIKRKYNTYDFSELNESAKERARQWYLDDDMRSSDWENEIEQDLMTMFPNSDLHIQFSLNSCQGDGVNIYGELAVFAIQNFKFLGFAVGRNGKGIYVRVHPKSWKKFKSRLKELSSRKRCQSIKPSLEKIKVYARGWLNYYGIASMKNNIDDINGWLYHRIRMCIWKQWKKPRTKVRNLIKMGVPKDLAMQAGNTRRGHWFATHTVAVNMAMTKERLINSGFYDLATAYQSVHVNY